MKYLLLLLSVIMCGCIGHKKDDFELEFLNDEINSLVVEPSEYLRYLKIDTPAPIKSQTILRYKLTNNTEKVYYFNVDAYTYDMETQYVKLACAWVGFKDSEGKFSLVRAREPYRDYVPEDSKKTNNFVIHPNETLYFEELLVLPFGTLKDVNYSTILDSKKQYMSEMIIYSDTLNSKHLIPRADLQTIKHNNYEVFQGVIRSRNKIPVKFNNLGN